MAKRKTATPAKPEPTIRTRGVEVRAGSWNEEERTLSVVITTETPVRMGVYDETLLMSGAQFPSQVPFLDSHNRWEIADHIGSVKNIRVEGDAMVGEARLARTPGGDMAAALIADGHLTDVSVGYRIDDEVFVPAGKTHTEGDRTFEGPMYVVRKWSVMEVSAVSIGADPLAKIRSDELEEVNPRAEAQEVIQMTEDQPKEVPTVVDVNKEREAAAQAELDRVRAIRDTGRAARVDAKIIDECIDQRLTPEEANKRFLKEFSMDHEAKPANITIERDAHDTLCRGLEAGIQLRAGLKVADKDREIAREYAGARLSDMARIYLQSRGETRLPHDPEALIGLAFDQRRNRRKLRLQGIETRALTTSDFPSLLANVANKALAVAYMEQPSTYQLWTRAVSIPDFKSRSVPQLSGVADLALVPEAAPITNSSLSDRTETYAIGTYAKIIPLTRQALVNDDLSAFTRLPAMAGAAARRTVNKSVYNIINAGATSAWNMSDSVALFDASTHKNYGTTGTALAVGTLQTGRKTMRVQTGLAGEVLNIEPRYLLTTPTNEMTAAELLTSDARVASGFSAGVVNVFRNTMTLIIEAEMEVGASGAAASWALAADPNQIDTVEVGFLNGVDAPTLEEQDDFDSFGTRWRVFIDFGVKPIDWRGLFKATGAA